MPASVANVMLWGKRVGAVAWAPGSADVVYLGTGEGDTLIAGGTGYIPGIGLLRSDDGGETWTFPTGDENPITDLFFALDIDPDNDEIVFAATDSGLLGTEDGGVNWQALVEIGCGLVIQTSPTDSGKLQRSKTASAAAATIWPGMGINATNKPTKKAMAEEYRLICHRLLA